MGSQTSKAVDSIQLIPFHSKLNKEKRKITSQRKLWNKVISVTKESESEIESNLQTVFTSQKVLCQMNHHFFLLKPKSKALINMNSAGKKQKKWGDISSSWECGSISWLWLSNIRCFLLDIVPSIHAAVK